MDGRPDPQAGADPFLPAERSEDDLQDAEDGSASRRAARLEQLGLIASRSITALVLFGAGALTAKIVSLEQPSPVAPPTTSVGEAGVLPRTAPARAYPALAALLGEEDGARRHERRGKKESAKVRRSQVRFSAGAGPSRQIGGGAGAPITPPASGTPHQAGQDPGDTQSGGGGGGDGKKAPKPKPPPEPKPDRNLYHVWKQGTADHAYYWEDWKTLDYYAPQEYYLYRDGNGSEGSFFSKQVQGTVPLITDDGHLGYAYEAGGSGRLPLYYLRGPNDKRRRDLFTSDAATRDRFLGSGWADFGIVAYLGAPLQ